MEPSEVFLWPDMLLAVEKMAGEGVAGRRLYAGPTSGNEWESGHQYALANLAAFLANSMQESIQYDACDENNWSQPEYAVTSACGQLGEDYQNYHCWEMADPETGEMIPAEEMECAVDPEMVMVARTHAKWYGAPAPLFCAPKSIIPEAPRWNAVSGWCPTEGTASTQAQAWAEPFGSIALGEIHYGPGESTESVPPAVLAVYPHYLDYVKASIDKVSGESCQMDGECCMDIDNQLSGSWESCAGGCPNQNGRTDVEGCCWWGRGVIQTTGVCNFGKLNYFVGAKAAQRFAGTDRTALYPDVDFCLDPEIVCRPDGPPDLKWVAGFFYWLESVQPYDHAGGNYMEVLHAWVANGMDPDDHTLIDFASGIVNRGSHTAHAHGLDSRRANFQHFLEVFAGAFAWEAPDELSDSNSDSEPTGSEGCDECGVCGGDNSSCAGCDGVPNSGKAYDVCNVCDGDGSSCNGSLECPSGTTETATSWRQVFDFDVSNVDECKAECDGRSGCRGFNYVDGVDGNGNGVTVCTMYELTKSDETSGLQQIFCTIGEDWTVEKFPPWLSEVSMLQCGTEC